MQRGRMMLYRIEWRGSLEQMPREESTGRLLQRAKTTPAVFQRLIIAG
jgi:hypothetical protein